MFGLRNRVEHLAATVAGYTYVRRLDCEKIEKLEGKIEELTKALEWHVGTSIEILVNERKLTKLKIAEHKSLVEETGSAELVGRGDQDGERAGTKMG